MNRREERFEQVGAERQQIIRVREIHDRQTRDSGGQLHRFANGRRVKWIVGNNVQRAVRRGKSLENCAHRAALGTSGQEGHCLRRTLKLLQLGHEKLHRFLPRN